MSTRRMSFVLVVILIVLVHASDARNFPSDQKTFLPCIPSKSISGDQQAFDVHASEPTAKSPAGDGLTDEKNFIYGGVGGYAGMGGVIGGIPLLSGFGGIGSVGGVGGFVGVGGLGGGSGLGGSGSGGGLGGSGSGGGLGGSGGAGGLGGGGLLPSCP